MRIQNLSRSQMIVALFALFLLIVSLFRMLGDKPVLAFVIGSFGFKPEGKPIEPLAPSEPSFQPNEILVGQMAYTITKYEYEEMLKINDVIQTLKVISARMTNYNYVHFGWGQLHDRLEYKRDNFDLPFFDGLNRQLYDIFLEDLFFVTEIINNVADPDSRAKSDQVKMFDEIVDVVIHPKIHGEGQTSMGYIVGKEQEVLSKWADLKKQVTERYEKERSQQ